jgi:hypothetical protein
VILKKSEEKGGRGLVPAIFKGQPHFLALKIVYESGGAEK